MGNENNILDFIDKNYHAIETDVNSRNSTSKNRGEADNKTRKKREELSVSRVNVLKRRM